MLLCQKKINLQVRKIGCFSEKLSFLKEKNQTSTQIG